VPIGSVLALKVKADKLHCVVEQLAQPALDSLYHVGFRVVQPCRDDARIEHATHDYEMPIDRHEFGVGQCGKAPRKVLRGRKRHAAERVRIPYRLPQPPDRTANVASAARRSPPLPSSWRLVGARVVRRALAHTQGTNRRRQCLSERLRVNGLHTEHLAPRNGGGSANGGLSRL
jgi:hypothetical protein